jgi:uncharacterized protein involved in exopolysaccharide biosynthesis
MIAWARGPAEEQLNQLSAVGPTSSGPSRTLIGFDSNSFRECVGQFERIQQQLAGELANNAQLNSAAQQRLPTAGAVQARLQGLVREMQAACSAVLQTLEAHRALLNASGAFFSQCDQLNTLLEEQFQLAKGNPALPDPPSVERELGSQQQLLSTLGVLYCTCYTTVLFHNTTVLFHEVRYYYTVAN